MSRPKTEAGINFLGWLVRSRYFGIILLDSVVVKDLRFEDKDLRLEDKDKDNDFGFEVKNKDKDFRFEDKVKDKD